MNAITSFIFGLTIAVSIGPIALLIINRSINCGLRKGLVTGLAAASADFTYAIVSFLSGAAITALLIQYEFWLHAFASGILILFGLWMLFNAIKSRKREITSNNSSCDRAFITTYALTIANPLTIIAFTGFAAQSSISGLSTIVFCSVALFAGSLIIQMLLALFGNQLKKHISNSSAIFYLNIMSASFITLLGFIKLF